MSSFTLKLIALLSMLWDHITAVWPLQIILWPLLFPEAETLPPLVEAAETAGHSLGRVAAPIFLWSISIGYRHTRDIKRYALRLLFFACLAEWPYFLLFGCHGNILFTLLIGLLTLRGFELLNAKRSGLGWALALGVIALLELLHFPEGQGRYVLFILVFYLTEGLTRRKRALLWLLLYPASRWRLLLLCFTEGFSAWSVRTFLLNGFGPLLGVALTLFYNGKKGPEGKGLKYLWYVAYPTHLLLLALVKLCRGW